VTSATRSIVSIDVAAAATLIAANVINVLTSQASAANGDAVVEVTLTVRAIVALVLPAGVNAGQMAQALQKDMCSGLVDCFVVAITAAFTSRRDRRALQTSSTSFAVERTFNTSSADSLQPPSINTTAVASEFGVDPSAVNPSTTVQAVTASVTVVSSGSAASAAAQSAAQAQTSALAPASLAAALGVRAADLVTTTSTVGPPLPPPALPPPLPPSVVPSPVEQPSSSPPPPPLRDTTGGGSGGSGGDVFAIGLAAGGAAVILVAAVVYLRWRRMQHQRSQRVLIDETKVPVEA
jgi:hypothetical protein